MSTTTATRAAPETLAPRGEVHPSSSSASAAPADLDLICVNDVVAASLASWSLPARVRRLALRSLLYNEVDLDQMDVVLVEKRDAGVAVAAWEAASGRDAVPQARSVLLHGLYVIPGSQGQGLGTSLLEFVSHRMLARGFDGIIARVWRESESFFRNRGFTPLTGSDPADSYPLRMWRTL